MSEKQPNRQNRPRYHERTPIYIQTANLSRTKRQYVETLSQFSQHLLAHTQGSIVVPGVGGFQEPQYLHDVFGQQVISLDVNPQVIERHKDNLISQRKQLGQQTEEADGFEYQDTDHEVLVVGDVRRLPIYYETAKLLSLSSVLHEVVSGEKLNALHGERSVLFDSTTKPAERVTKEAIVRKQIQEVQRVIKPGGILAIRDILPQPNKYGTLAFKSETARLFYQSFETHHAELFMKKDSYQKSNEGSFGGVSGSYNDLSEVWWHFRWWWVDQIRRFSPKEIKQKFLEERGLKPTNEAVAELSNSRKQELLTHFDSYSPLQTYAQERFGSETSLSGFREWGEEYNFVDGIWDERGFVNSMFGTTNGNGNSHHWYVCAYTPPDRRDNHLLRAHFELFNEEHEAEAIEPRRLMVFALKPLGGNQTSTDISRFSDMRQIADSHIGGRNRVLPVPSEWEHIQWDKQEQNR